MRGRIPAILFPTALTTVAAGAVISYSDFEWGSKLWLLDREKLTEEVRLRAENYARLAMQPLLRNGYARNAQVIATIPRMYVLGLTIILTRPDKTELTVEIKKRWEAIENGNI
ncbi:Phage protein GP46 [Pluralibacter gergoviae]|nr:Phage protein GP46 [Pluralibacter gergoviae]